MPDESAGSRQKELKESKAMAGSVLGHEQHHDEWVPPTGEQLAERLFAVVMAGVVGVIVLMIVMGGW